MVKSFFKLNKKDRPSLGKPGFLEGIKVKDSNGKEVVISDLWKHQTCILKVLRRFGCPLCRYESRLLSELKEEFDGLGVKLVAVGFEDVGLRDFLVGGYWNWQILIDSERSIDKALDIPRTSALVSLKDFMSTATRAAIAAVQKVGITGDSKGDDFQLGGTFVVEKETGKLLYEFRQVEAGAYTSLREIYEACGGDPDDIEEKAPEECIAYGKRYTSKEADGF